jgi:hypothetical protein
MSRQTELMAISEAKTQKKFRFYLQNASQGLLLLRYEPGGWGDSKFELKRNDRYMGLFRSISFNDLKWVKDARDYIRDVYESQGINAIIMFTVERLDDTTGAYVNYFTGKLDLSTYKIEETAVSCQVIDTSFAEKVKNRENLKVNIRQRISVEGYEIPAFSDEDPALNIPDYEIVARATWGNRLQMTSTLDNHYVPLWEGITEFVETQHQSCTIPIADDKGMFINSAADRSIKMTGTLSGQVNFATAIPHSTFTIKLYIAGVASGTIGTVSGTGVNFLIFNFTINEDLTVLTGQDFWLQGTLSHSGETVYNDVQVDISEVQESVNGGPIIAYPIYEAFLRTIQIIADDNDVLKSDKFGRTDSEVVTYASDGQLGHIAKGLFIRGSQGLNNVIALSLVEMFTSLSAVFNLAMGIETVSGKDKVVIEDLDYFFDSAVVADLSARISENTIGKEVIAGKHFNSIVTGYNSFEYLIAGGLAEYNTKMEFSTVISVLDNKLDIVSKDRADTQGVINLRKSIASDNDVKGDEDIWVLDSVRVVNPIYDFQVRTDEGFTSVTGGADAENSFNLDLTPKRNLLRHGNVIRAGLEKNLGTYLRWQTGDKNTTLATQLTTETDPVVENADVLVNDLEEPFFLPELYTVECEMKYADLTAILTNTKGLIKLADGKYGWIMSLIVGNKENKATLQLLRANLNVITPT